MEFAPWPYFSDDEIQAVVNVLKSGRINQWTGNEINAFEKEFSHYIGTNHAVAIANGSLALDLALMALNIGKGDEVIVTPRSFVASAGCVALRGAIPVFVDVDPVSQNITPETVSKAVSKKTKAVIAVNLAGWPCDLKRIKSLCEQNKIFLIEDCAQSLGAKFEGNMAGSFGDCAIFSFCQDKIMTTGGEGGMLVTNNPDIWEKVWSYKDHGKNFDTVFRKDHQPGFKWLVDSFGTNCRMTEMQAAMGRVMLKKVDGWVRKRREFAGWYEKVFKTIPGLRAPIPEEEVYHSYYKYYVFINQALLKKSWNRTAIINALNELGIPCNTGVCPELYREKAFNTCKYKIRGGKRDKSGPYLPVARQLGETSIMFMVHPTLKPESVHYILDQVALVMGKACKN
jgi:dTDP-4-amino-4,6-dideoxygalactose transaminase